MKIKTIICLVFKSTEHKNHINWGLSWAARCCTRHWRDMMWCDMMWCDVTWCDVVWRDVTWCGVMWCVMWCDVMWRDVVWCHVAWCDVVWCDVMRRNVMWHDVMKLLCNCNGPITEIINYKLISTADITCSHLCYGKLFCMSVIHTA